MHRPLPTLLIAAWALFGCDVYDSGRIQPSMNGSAGTSAMPMDSGPGKDASQGDADGGEDDAGMCVPRGTEECNLRDDDCDGRTDEDSQSACEAIIPNGVVECVALNGAPHCVLRKCLDGFVNCDGDPANGCEPYCMCHVCPLDDGGDPVAADDGGSQ